MFRALLLIPLLFACSEQDLQDLGDLPYDWSQPSGERVRVETFGKVSFRPGGPTVAGGDVPDQHPYRRPNGSNWFDVAVVDDALGLVVYAEGAELILFTQRSDATSWTQRDTAGGATSLDRSDVWFAAGTAVQLLDETDQARLVRYAGDFIDVEVWLPIEHVDQVLNVDEAKTDRTPLDGDTLLVGTPAALYDAPDGTYLGELTANVGRSGWQRRVNGESVHRVNRVGDDRLGYTPIEVSDGRVTVTAWVEAQDIAEPYGGMSMSGWGAPFIIGCGARGFGGVWPVAPEGTPIYDGPEGKYVGEYVDDTIITDMGEPDAWGWTPVTFQTDWGPLEAWIEPDAYELR